MANLIDLIGRVLISLVFLLSGYNKILNYDGTISWMEGYGVPGIIMANYNIRNYFANFNNCWLQNSIVSYPFSNLFVWSQQ